ncbi:hypothetical protein C3L33_17369, partial [Rhododendron williamsianum]
MMGCSDTDIDRRAAMNSVVVDPYWPISTVRKDVLDNLAIDVMRPQLRGQGWHGPRKHNHRKRLALVLKLSFRTYLRPRLCLCLRKRPHLCLGVVNEIDTDERIDRCAQAYLLYVLWCTLFCDKSGTKVLIAYLSLLEYLDRVATYGCGASSLAFLYRQLGHANRRDMKQLSGVLTLLEGVLCRAVPKQTIDVDEKPPKDNGCLELLLVLDRDPNPVSKPKFQDVFDWTSGDPRNGCLIRSGELSRFKLIKRRRIDMPFENLEPDALTQMHISEYVEFKYGNQLIAEFRDSNDCTTGS